MSAAMSRAAELKTSQQIYYGCGFPSTVHRSRSLPCGLATDAYYPLIP